MAKSGTVTNNLTALVREQTGKGASRRARREGRVPAVLYGHGTEPQHLELNAHDLAAVLRHSGTNAVLSLDIAGTEQLALTKQVQVDPIRRVLEHVDFVAVKRGEKVTVDVPVHVVGDAAAERAADGVERRVDDGDVELHDAVAEAHRGQRQRRREPGRLPLRRRVLLRHAPEVQGCLLHGLDLALGNQCET